VISRRKWAYIAIAGIAVASGYLLFGSSEERRVLGVIREVTVALGSLPGDTAASRQRRIARALGEHAVEELVVIVTPELEPLEGRAAAVEAATLLSGMELEIAIQDSNVRIGADRRARANLVVGVSASVPGTIRSDRRNVHLVLEAVGGNYRIRRAEVGPPSAEEPEARP